MTEVPDVRPWGPIARFDNEVYFYMHNAGRGPYLTVPQVFVFIVFLGEDGVPWTPPMRAAIRSLSTYRGLRSRSFGRFRGDPQSRARLFQVRDKLRAQWAMLTVREATPSAKFDAWHPEPLGTDDPKRWAQAQFGKRPNGFAGRLGYDWPSLGRTILDELDDVRKLLTTMGAR